MSSTQHNLSSFSTDQQLSADIRIGIVVADWNQEITHSLLQGAQQTLLRAGLTSTQIVIKFVPGSFELPLGAQWLLENQQVHAVICLGCVIQGETPHFTFISQAVADGIMRLNIDYNLPVIFGVLTVNSLEQAKDRSGGMHGNKGDEAAYTAIRMIALQQACEK